MRVIRVWSVVVSVVIALLGLASCTSAAEQGSTGATGTATVAAATTPVTTASATAAEVSLTPPVSMASTPAESSAPVSGPAAPSVVRTDGYATVALAGVRLNVGRGSAAMTTVGVAGYFVTVCATGAAQVALSPDQFTLISADGNQVMPRLSSGGYSPAFQAGTIGSGDCASGYLSFDLSRAQSDAYLLSWVGDQGQALWSFSG